MKRRNLTRGDRVVITGEFYQQGFHDNYVAVYPDYDKTVRAGDGVTKVKLKSVMVPKRSVVREIDLFPGGRPEIRVKAFKPAKYQRLAQECLDKLTSQDIWGETTWCGDHYEKYLQVAQAISLGALFSVLPANVHPVLIDLIQGEIILQTHCALSDPESPHGIPDYEDVLYLTVQKTMKCELELVWPECQP